jgi:ribonuclease HI
MGAGFAVGADPVPAAVLAVRVGGPLSSLRAEAAGLLQLLILRKTHPAPLLVFVDSLVMLNILQHWGKADFNPDPNDVVHFDVILPLLEALRQWPHPVRLMKVKSHTGCLLNERADEQAELGYDDTAQEICPAPQKFGSLALRTRQHVRELVQGCNKALPRDSAPNQNIIKSVVGANTRRAACMRNTIFVRQLLHQKEEKPLHEWYHDAAMQSTVCG